MEFDHFFICVDKPADAAQQLIDFGLTEGTSNHHPGQGTANRRFFFQNSFLEILFVTDTNELLSDLTKPTNLYERFQSNSTEASPFGVCFRPSSSMTEVPFNSWSYKPHYLPQNLDIAIGQSSSSEPMWFYLPFGTRPDIAPPEKRQAVTHACGFETITSVKVVSTSSDGFSQPANEANKVTGIEYLVGEEHLVEICFDSMARGSERDFRSTMPLIFRW